MSKRRVNHTSNGIEYLEKGLESVNEGDIDKAIEYFYHAAVAFDRAQDYRRIPALWEAIGDMLEPDFEEKRSEYLNVLQKGRIQDVYDKWYQFPLVYCPDAAQLDNWRKQTDPMHRQAWAYEWAGKHRERIGDGGAYKLFLRAAEKAEQTKDGKKYPEWPAKLYHRCVLSYIRVFGSVDDEKIREAIRKMEIHYFRIKERLKAYRLLANASRLLKSNLIDAGNLAEAEQFKKKERSALMHYHLHKRSYFHAIAEWLSGSGFMYFITGLFLMVLFVFPWVYYQWNLVISSQGTITYFDSIRYSIEAALNIGHNDYYAVGWGELLNIVEAALSWLGLGIFIWWLTRRLE